MLRSFPVLFTCALVLLPLKTRALAQTPPASRTVADWERWPAPGAKTVGATAAVDEAGELQLTMMKKTGGAGLVVRAPEGAWNLEAFKEIAVPVRNLSQESVRVILEVRDAASSGKSIKAHRRSYTARASVPAGGETVWLVVPLGSKTPAPLTPRLLSLANNPADFARHGSMDGASIARLDISITDAAAGARVAIGQITARGVPEPFRDWPESQAFPLVDEFGQYRHRDWPGKIGVESDFVARLRDEDAELSLHPRPAGWNKYGGWAAGPQLRATGFFRVEKVRGRWWLVDPEGRLFWSHGVVRVDTILRLGGIYRGTPVPGREHLLTLPPKNSPAGAFYGPEAPSTRGYYFGRGPHEAYDYLEANLFRKFGPEYREAFRARALRRLESWGMNTIANSSDPAIYLRHKIPYTAIVYSAPMGDTAFRVEGSDGNWGKLPDPFDPAWRAHMDKVLRTELKDSLNDPWCLGFFVDNELKWGDPCHVAETVLRSPASQPSKRALVAFILRKKYPTIASLNSAWATAHASWDALLASTTPPGREHPAAKADLEAMSERFLDEYFGGCRAALRAASPNHLYLGARFAHPTWFVSRVAARHCDVFSENIYAPDLRQLRLAPGLDQPVLIGEFHFGALDRGPFSATLIPVPDQAARARAYREYVRSALLHPNVIGTHWHQFHDQPATGRFDGENFQNGLVDICDTPYAETIGAIRATAATLYQTRHGSGAAK